jgi:hypothetical protein
MRSRIVAIAAAAFAITSCAPSMERITLSIKGVPFSVQVARSDAERERGLMFRKSLGVREGMLFVFDYDEHLTFWMRNTELPLTVGFLTSEGKILEIKDMTPFSLDTVRSRFSCRYALELSQGAFRDIGASEGDIAQFPIGFK